MLLWLTLLPYAYASRLSRYMLRHAMPILLPRYDALLMPPRLCVYGAMMPLRRCLRLFTLRAADIDFFRYADMFATLRYAAATLLMPSGAAISYADDIDAFAMPLRHIFFLRHGVFFHAT